MPTKRAPRTGPRRRANDSRLTQLRMARGLTQQELADRVQADLRTVRRWEHGEATISRAYLIPMAEALRCKLTDLI